MGTLRAAAVMAATLSFAVFASPASADSTVLPAGQEEPAGGIGLRLTEAPVSAGEDPRARVYIVDHLAPGAVIERRIEVSNSTASSQHVVLYAAAASIEDGSFVGAAGHTANELSSWISVTPAEMDVATKSALAASVIVAVPADAAPGEQYGVVWAEARSEPGSDGGVAQVSRVGIRLYVSVGPGGAPAADFTIDSLTASRSRDGLPVVSASVHNTGGRALDMNGSLLLTAGPGGLSAGPFGVDLGRTLAIADTQSVHITLDERVPSGPWDASITLASGSTQRTVEATITFPDEGTVVAVDTRATGTTTLWVPFALVGMVMLLAVCGIGIAVWRRRRRTARRWAAPTGTPVHAPGIT